MAAILARGLRRRFGKSVALDGFDLRVEEGHITGLIGPNGAGKSTALHAMLGLLQCDGEVQVLGRNPWRERAALMGDVAFVADVAVLPGWMQVSQAMELLAGLHPRFDRRRAKALLSGTGIRSDSRVSELSKGMVTQLHLSLVLAIDARLLVLDEPTLGLDLVFRKKFYDSLLTEYCDGNRTVLISTHEVDEVQHVLSDVAFMDRGRTVLACSTEELESRYSEVMVRPEAVASARLLGPIQERAVLGGSVLVFDGTDRRRLEEFGQVRTPSIADLFLAVTAAPANEAMQ